MKYLREMKVKSMRNAKGFILERRETPLGYGGNVGSVEGKGHFCVIKNLSRGRGYLKSLEPTAPDVLSVEGDKLSEAVVGLATRYSRYGIRYSNATVKRVRTQQKLAESWHFILFPTEVSYLSTVASTGFLHVSSPASIT